MAIQNGRKIANDQMIVEIARKSQMSRREVETVLAAFRVVIIASVARGERLSWAHVGIWSLRRTRSKNARNPRTGEPIVVPARDSVGLAVSETLNTAVLTEMERQ